MTRHRSGHRPPSQRQLRVGEEIRHVLSQVLGRGELNDPALSDRSITVTEVQVSPDLHYATVFVMPLGEALNPETQADLFKGLSRSAPYLRRKVNEAMYLRVSPKLTFELDATFAAVEHLEEVLGRPEVSRDLTPIQDDNVDPSDQESGGESGDGP
jgi:ribosome-binding factor A